MRSRRWFLKAGGAALLGCVAAPAFVRRALAQQAPAAGPGPARPRTLVCIFQRGAVDGLSMVVPYAEPAYYRVRRRIAIAPPAPAAPATQPASRATPGTAAPPGAMSPASPSLALDARFALHPALAPLAPLFRAGELAVVHAVGAPDATRSHFDAQHHMESGCCDGAVAGGFLNRALAAERGAPSPFAGIAMGSGVPESLQGAVSVLAVEDLDAFGVRAGRPEVRDRLEHAFGALYDGAPGDLVARSGREALSAVETVRRLAGTTPGAQNGAVYPRGPLGRQLAQVARLLRAELGVRVVCVESGGWDTHVGQGDAAQGRLAPLLSDLGGALAAFRQDLGERMDDVVVLTMSEFGRTVAENGTGGTDHGHGTAMFVLGGGVRGGRVYGRWPGLEREQLFEARDLAVTTDFRDLFGELVARQLGVADLAGVFPGYALRAESRLGVLAAG